MNLKAKLNGLVNLIVKDITFGLVFRPTIKEIINEK